jgi:hypothetical protein
MLWSAAVDNAQCRAPQKSILGVWRYEETLMRTFQVPRRQNGRSDLILRAALVLALAGVIACGPGRAEIDAQKREIADLRAQNEKLLERVRELEVATQEAPDTLFAKIQDAQANKEYAAVVQATELLLIKHPSSDRIPAARKLAAAARKNIAEAEARSRAEIERAQKRERAAAEASQQRRVSEVRRLLHHNLDGAGGGFVRGWRWNGDTFVLIVDERKYVSNSAIAAAMTARSIFDTGDVALPSTLVFRDTNGHELDRGPFSNVPRVVP